MKLTSKRQFISAILMALAMATPMAIAATPAPTPVSWLFVEEEGVTHTQDLMTNISL